MLETRALGIGFAAKPTARLLLDRVELRAEPGELVAVLGANGVGKTSLMRTLAGLLPPLAGGATWRGQPLPWHDRAAMALLMAHVPTVRPALPYATVAELVALGRSPHNDWLGRLRPADTRAIREALEGCGIAHLADHPLDALSDGQRQKAFIAKGLAQDTPLLLLDEPTAFLDLANKHETLALLRQLCDRHRKAVLFTTHDLGPSLRVADRVWLLLPGQALQGSPEALAEQGAYDRLFPNGGLRFDSSLADFAPHAPDGRPIRLLCPADQMAWAKIILNRNHFTTSDLSEDYLAHGSEAWRLGLGGVLHRFERLSQLDALLKQQIRTNN